MLNTVWGYRMKKNVGLGLLVFTSVVCLSFFQNCSKIATADLQKTSGLSLNDLNGFADSAPVVTNNDQAAIVTVDESNDPVAPAVVAASAPAVVVVEQAKAPVVASHQELPDSDLPDSEIKHDDIDAAELKHVDDDDKDDLVSDLEAAAVSACLDKNKNMKDVLTGSVFIDLKGSHTIVSNQIAEISDSNGKLLVRAQSDRSRVDKISNFGGKLILCNADVDLIEKVHGKLILINSHVKEITGHKGIVKSINSTILKFDGKFKIVAF